MPFINSQIRPGCSKLFFIHQFPTRDTLSTLLLSTKRPLPARRKVVAETWQLSILWQVRKNEFSSALDFIWGILCQSSGLWSVHRVQRGFLSVHAPACCLLKMGTHGHSNLAGMDALTSHHLHGSLSFLWLQACSSEWLSRADLFFFYCEWQES